MAQARPQTRRSIDLGSHRRPSLTGSVGSTHSAEVPTGISSNVNGSGMRRSMRSVELDVMAALSQLDLNTLDDEDDFFETFALVRRQSSSEVSVGKCCGRSSFQSGSYRRMHLHRHSVSGRMPPRRRSCLMMKHDNGAQPYEHRRYEQGISRSRSADCILPKRVSFSHLQMRMYENVLGVNPACSDGPPVDLGWRYDPDLTLTLSVDEYDRSAAVARAWRRSSLPASTDSRVAGVEGIGGVIFPRKLTRERESKHHFDEFLTSSSVRESLLLDSGYDKSEIDHATKMARKVRSQRRQSFHRMGIDSLADKCSRKIRRAVWGKAHSTGDLAAEWTSATASSTVTARTAAIEPFGGGDSMDKEAGAKSPQILSWRAHWYAGGGLHHHHDRRASAADNLAMKSSINAERKKEERPTARPFSAATALGHRALAPAGVASNKNEEWPAVRPSSVSASNAAGRHRDFGLHKNASTSSVPLGEMPMGGAGNNMFDPILWSSAELLRSEVATKLGGADKDAPISMMGDEVV